MKKNIKIEYISMAEAERVTPYTQDYLSLLARRGQIQAKKIGRKWYTTIDWLNEYLKNVKPESIIKKEKKKKKKTNPDKNFSTAENKISNFILSKVVIIWLVSLFLLVLLGALIFKLSFNRIKKIEKRSKEFIPQEILKIPNEDGGYDVYSEGRVKIGKE